MTEEGPHYDIDDPDQEQVSDLLALNESRPYEPEIVTTPAPKVTKKKLKYVKQREEIPKKTPHWNPVGERWHTLHWHTDISWLAVHLLCDFTDGSFLPHFLYFLFVAFSCL